LKPGKVEWNFAKFLIGRDGTLVGRWAPATDPDSRLIRNAIDQALKEAAPRD
jgi:glutathione peroxidase